VSRSVHLTAARSPTHSEHVTVAIWVLAALAAAALAGVIYLLWPRWPGTPASDAPTLPIVVGDVAFNMPRAAIRQAVQRRPGAQSRVDLVYVWPTLAPAAIMTKPEAGAPQPPERLFVTIAEAPATAMTPAERLKTVYPRYATGAPVTDGSGLATASFRPDTPYRNEDLVFDPAAPDRFIARCTRDQGLTPGTCLAERFVGGADITVRFARDWLTDWRGVVAAIDRVIGEMQPTERE